MRPASIAATLLSTLLLTSYSFAEPPTGAPSWNLGHGPLRVSADGRFIIHADGAPFLYLSDTNWELIPRSRREDAERLLETRRRQGFTVITVPVTGILDEISPQTALARPNMYGDLAFASADVTRPIQTPGADPSNAAEYDYWDHVAYIIDLAESKGMYVALIPSWRIHYELGLIDVRNARAYGQFLGARFGARSNIVWVLGGDTNVERADAPSIADQLRESARSVWRRMRQRHQRAAITPRLFRELAAGIRETEAIRHLMSYHPALSGSSADWFHHDDWLDFHMTQSGNEVYDFANYQRITADYARRPAKPVMDGEARYEDHAVRHRPELGWMGGFDVRQGAYWSLFAGAHGHAYGNRGVWQMYEPGREPHLPLRFHWYDALNLPGAQSMRHVRDLMTSRPMLGRIPDQSLVRDALDGGAHIQATRGDGYAFVYNPSGANVEIRLSALGADRLVAWWFDPRNGAAARIGVFETQDWRAFDPPGEPVLGNDWVLVLDDAARAFPPPGSGQNIVPMPRLTPGPRVERPAAPAPRWTQNLIMLAVAAIVASVGLFAWLRTRRRGAR